MPDTSVSLLERVRLSSDAAAWDRLVDVYRPLLARWLARYDVQDADADDLIQDVMLVVLRELPAFEHNRQTGAFRKWLRTVLVNRLREYWRKRDLAAGGSVIAARLAELEDERSGLSRLWSEEHDAVVVQRLLSSLQQRFEDKTWQAFSRQVFDGRRADAVARELGLSLSSVYAAKSRVLSMLRREAQGLID